METRRVVVLGPGEGEIIPDVPVFERHWLARGEDTGGAYEVLEFRAPPGRKVPRHIHHNCEEAFLVLEGEKFIEVDGRVVRAPAGSFVLVPRGVPHSHWNSDDTAVRFLLIFSPPGMGEYFRERGEILLRAAKTDASDFEGETFRELERLAERYGMEFVPEGAAGS